MAERNREFRTGERVNDAGKYVSTAGEQNEYREGDTFAACPATGRDTIWTRDNDDCGC
ncbi:hypothetical protein [Paludifilum halophilum]|uniref:hypothetical protein n=1 Tax=Paludifilum halophilum TaxID=1642702 RepID=UPI00146EF311|nr:hypothetical protein [Paludifilum halophilum]